MIFYRFLANDTAFRSSSELDSFSDLVHHICMSYISDLRKKLGHQTIIQCAASIIIVNPEGELLLGKRTDNGYWGYSGGSLEIDEEVEDCARRELKEEIRELLKWLER